GPATAGRKGKNRSNGGSGRHSSRSLAPVRRRQEGCRVYVMRLFPPDFQLYPGIVQAAPARLEGQVTVNPPSAFSTFPRGRGKGTAKSAATSHQLGSSQAGGPFSRMREKVARSAG